MAFIALACIGANPICTGSFARWDTLCHVPKQYLGFSKNCWAVEMKVRPLILDQGQLRQMDGIDQFDPSLLGSGAPDDTKVLCGNGEWRTPPSKPTVIHGYFMGKCTSITGTTRRYVTAPTTVTKLSLRVPVAIASPSTVTLKKSGVAVATATLPANATTFDSPALSVGVAVDDYLTLDLESAGITDLAVQIICN